MKRDQLFQWMSISLVTFWLICFAFIPYLFILMMSFISLKESNTLFLPITLNNYYAIIFELRYLKIFWQSFKLATVCTSCCLMIAYPFAYLLTQTKTRYKQLLLLFIIIPFWTSSLIRTYAIIAILKVKGILNGILFSIGLIQTPLQLLYTNTAVIIGLVYDLLPFMILPLYTSFEKLDKSYIDAARDLGANRIMIFTHVIIPLTLPGILSGSCLVFLPAMSLFYIPDILGGSRSLFLGNLIQRQFLTDHWDLGSTLSILLVGVLVVLLLIIQRFQKRSTFYQDFL